MTSVLILGANYGLLFAMRLALGGHNVDVVCREGEISALNKVGINVYLAARGGNTRTTISSKTATLNIRGISASEAESNHYDFAVLAMQEGQFANDQLYSLVKFITRKKLPVISLMNMATAPFLKTLKGGWDEKYSSIFHGGDIWQLFDQDYFSQSSPDPQAFKPHLTKPTHLQVRLASNFKLAPFPNQVANAALAELCKTANAAPCLHDGVAKPRVNLIAVRSKYVPLAKWPMLIAGNYRCITDSAPISIKDAIFDDLAKTRSIYAQVAKLCRSLGAEDADLVPFEAYLKAAENLDKPSSVSRAAEQPGAKLERMDLLVSKLCEDHDIPLAELGGIVERLERKLVQS
jgi:hypothetical protein